MKLSLKGEYAIRALLVLGLHYDDRVVSIGTISTEQNIPKRFLEQILTDLKSAGLVESKRGISVVIGWPNHRTKFRSRVWSATSKVHWRRSVASAKGFMGECSCPDESRCAIRSVMKEIRDAVVKIAERVTIADMCERARSLNTRQVVPFDFEI